MLIFLGERTPLILLAGSVVGCAGMLAGWSGQNISDAPSVQAENPLGGTPVNFDCPPRHNVLDGIHQRECTVWPIADRLTVTASPSRVCVQATVHRAGDAPPVSDIKPNWLFVSDGAKETPIAIAVSEGAKIGQCTKPNAAPERLSIWRQTYEGCVDNNGVVVTGAKELAVRDSHPGASYYLARWQFK